MHDSLFFKYIVIDRVVLVNIGKISTIKNNNNKKKNLMFLTVTFPLILLEDLLSLAPILPNCSTVLTPCLSELLTY